MSKTASICSSWSDRFKDEHRCVITPDDKVVIKEAKKIDINDRMSNVEKANRLWDHVIETISYSESSRWKKPRETILERRADCEDFTFLLASMFPNLGIEKSVISVGKLTFPNGYTEFHTWNEVDGKIIDATGRKDDIDILEYEDRFSWEVSS